MKTRTTRLFWCLAIPVLLCLGYACWRHAPARSADGHGRKVAFYQDSMHPWIKSDKPGKCSICGMDLTPISEGEAGFAADDNLVALSPNNITVLHVQTEEVKQQRLARRLRVAGTLEANEARRVVVSAPVAGQIQALAVDYVGMEVKEGQLLLTLFSPELVQKRAYLSALGLAYGGPTNQLVPSKAHANPYSSDMMALQSGTVIERSVSAGQYVQEGEKLLTIADASMLWFRFDVYQRQLPWFELGQTIEVAVEGVPGKVFPAVISFLDPSVNDATRTVKVRADIQNPVVANNGHPRRLLRFGMYAEGLVRSEIPNVVAVPRAAIVSPGGTAYAYVDKGHGAYERRRVELGRQGDDYWEVLGGLQPGERVVTTGNVLIDAQAQFNQTGKPDNGGAQEVASAQPMAVEPDPPRPVVPPAHEAMAHEMAGRRPGGGAALPNAMAEVTVAADTMSLATLGRSSAVPRTDACPPGAMTDSRPLPDARGATNKALVYRDVRVARAATRDEMRRMRMATIAAAYAEENAATAPAGDRAAAQPASAMAQPVSAPVASPSAATPGVGSHTMAEDALGTAPAPQEGSLALAPTPPPPSIDKVRNGLSTQARMAAAAPADQPAAPKPAVASALTPDQRRALEAMLTEADGVVQALAADSLEKFQRRLTTLAAALGPLKTEPGLPRRWSGLVQRVADVQWRPAKDLDDAREQFLPFSTATAELVKQLRKEEPALARLKVFHCPMAPKPGLWVQLKGPLRNPFYGSKMLECGEEVPL